jgi:hypothetical protein
VPNGTACGWLRCQKHAGAVNRKPIALPDTLVYGLYGLTEEEIRTVEARRCPDTRIASSCLGETEP